MVINKLKYFVFLQFILFFLLTLSVQAQTWRYTGFGIKINYFPKITGWNEKPLDINFYSHQIQEPPKMNSFSIGLFFEFSKYKYLSTLIDFDIKFRDYNFNVVSGDINMLSLSGSEKLKYAAGKFIFYAFAGPRVDFYLLKSGFMDLVRQHADLKNFILGMTTGVGISFGKKHRFSLDFHLDPDFIKHFSSSTGSVRYNEYGLSLGYGYFTN